MKSIRIFISSPGDVANERQICGKVIERIQGRYWSLIRIEDVFWENEAMRATATFQDEIDDPAECEIVIGIIWTKMGSPLPERFKKIDGSPHANGTEWEIERAITAFENKIRAGEDPKAAFPNVVVYRRKETRTPLVDAAEEAKAKANEDYVEEYFRREFHNDDKFRTFKRASISYSSTDDFEKKLLKHLAKLVLKQIPVLKTAFNIPPISGSPFKALQAFEFHENDRFFGRTREIREIQTRLIRNARNGLPFILIYGGSGYGKSSLMKAGLAPALTRPGGSLGHIAGWRRVSFQPAKGEGTLCTRLARSILQGPDEADAARVRDLEHYPSIGLPELTDKSVDDKNWDVSSLATGLSDSDRRRDAAAAIAKSLGSLNRHLLLEIDQLEEVFTTTDVSSVAITTDKNSKSGLSKALRRQQLSDFFMAIGSLAQTGRVWVVATMRSEFFPRIAENPELFALVGKNRGYILPPPCRQSLWEIIRYPAFAARLEFEKRTTMIKIGEDDAKFDDLDEQILHDAESSPDALPLLEFSLQGLYDKSAGNTLTWKSYVAAGGLKGAIAKRATEVYDSLSEATKDARHKIFAALIHVDPARGTQTRKRAPLDSLKKAPGAAEFIQTFQDANLLITDEDDHQKESVVTLSHEALITHWEELSSWIKNHTGDLLARQRLAEHTRLWIEDEKRKKKKESFKNREKNKSHLLSEARLAEAERVRDSQLFDLEPLEIRFLELSEKRTKKRQRLLQASVMVFALLAVFATIAGWAADQNRKKAEEQTRLAVEAREEEQRQRAEAERQERLAKEQAKLALAAKTEEEKQRSEAEKQERVATQGLADSYFSNASNKMDSSRVPEGMAFLSAAVATRPDDTTPGDRLVYETLRNGVFVPVLLPQMLDRSHAISLFHSPSAMAGRLYLAGNFGRDRRMPIFPEMVEVIESVPVLVSTAGTKIKQGDPDEVGGIFQPLVVTSSSNKQVTLMSGRQSITTGIPILSPDRRTLGILHVEGWNDRTGENFASPTLRFLSYDGGSLKIIADHDTYIPWPSDSRAWISGMSWSGNWVLIRWRTSADLLEKVTLLNVDREDGEIGEFTTGTDKVFSLPGLTAVIELDDGNPGFVCARNKNQWVSEHRTITSNELVMNNELLPPYQPFQTQHGLPPSEDIMKSRYYDSEDEVPFSAKLALDGRELAATMDRFGRINISENSKVSGDYLAPVDPTGEGGNYPSEIAFSPDGQRLLFIASSPNDNQFWSLVDSRGRIIISKEGGMPTTPAYDESRGGSFARPFAFQGLRGEFLVFDDGDTFDDNGVTTPRIFRSRIRFVEKRSPTWQGHFAKAIYGLAVNSVGVPEEIPFPEQIASFQNLQKALESAPKSTWESNFLHVVSDRSLKPIVELSKGDTVRSVGIIGEIGYSEFAAKSNVSVDKLNELNGLALAPDTILADGSELYLPAESSSK